jgi:hypothetical protein
MSAKGPTPYWPERTDPQAHERECLAQVDLALDREFLAQTGKTIEEIGLRGRYPDTELYVRFRRKRDREAIEITWGLWGNDFGEVGRWGHAYPEQVGDEIMITIYEH